MVMLTKIPQIFTFEGTNEQFKESSRFSDIWNLKCASNASEKVPYGLIGLVSPFFSLSFFHLICVRADHPVKQDIDCSFQLPVKQEIECSFQLPSKQDIDCSFHVAAIKRKRKLGYRTLYLQKFPGISCIEMVDLTFVKCIVLVLLLYWQVIGKS